MKQDQLNLINLLNRSVASNFWSKINKLQRKLKKSKLIEPNGLIQKLAKILSFQASHHLIQQPNHNQNPTEPNLVLLWIVFPIVLKWVRTVSMNIFRKTR